MKRRLRHEGDITSSLEHLTAGQKVIRRVIAMKRRRTLEKQLPEIRIVIACSQETLDYRTYCLIDKLIWYKDVVMESGT